MLVANEFVKLFNLIHEREIGLDYFNWRFDPASGTIGSFSWADVKPGRLKGCIGLQLLQVNDFKVGLIVDAMVHPEHRDGLTFAYLNNQVEKDARVNDLKALIMLPNEQGAHAWSGDKEWKQVKQMVTYEVDRDFFPYATPYPPVSASGNWENIGSALSCEFKSLYPELAVVRRDTQYLTWRFRDNSFHYHEAYLVYDGDFLGYVVVKAFPDHDNHCMIGDIVDILWNKDNPKMIRKMLRTAMMHFSYWGIIDKITMWLQTNTILDTIAQDFGFVKTNQTRSFMVKVLDKDYTWLYDPSRWYLTMSDSEIY